jgi:hypothetical protein
LEDRVDLFGGNDQIVLIDFKKDHLFLKKIEFAENEVKLVWLGLVWLVAYAISNISEGYSPYLSTS